jgi:EAL domain-containing protein (putative c-di-GMP-specific phosphodiesterase class I)
MADWTRSKQAIDSLADVGIMVSIDDFGTGFSSLSRLSSAVHLVSTGSGNKPLTHTQL